jgi:hypothetical protein
VKFTNRIQTKRRALRSTEQALRFIDNDLPVELKEAIPLDLRSRTTCRGRAH